jgi:hypothetical protein
MGRFPMLSTAASANEIKIKSTKAKTTMTIL